MEINTEKLAGILTNHFYQKGYQSVFVEVQPTVFFDVFIAVWHGAGFKPTADVHFTSLKDGMLIGKSKDVCYILPVN